MPKPDRSKSSRDKVRAHRQRLRRQGLRPIQIWVPDVRSRSFKAQAHRQSVAVAESANAQEDQDFVDSVSEIGSA
ncbi:MAG: antitoxin MazE family protein [Gemmatimonadaceae bacterium]|nr:antitoxin MazE family protein [Gemmatimonadaceae bacterium]